jgi:hypothetical protein
MTILVGERAPFRIRILTTLLYPMSLPAHGFWLKLGPAQTRRSVVGRSQLRARSGRWRQIGVAERLCWPLYPGAIYHLQTLKS